MNSMRFDKIVARGFIIAGFCLIVNPGPTHAADSQTDNTLKYCGKAPTQNCRDFAALLTWLSKTGKIRTNYNDQRVDGLKLPSGGFAKARGVPAPTAEAPDRACSLMFDKDPSRPDAHPVCLVIEIANNDPTARKIKSSYIKLKLDGTPALAADLEGDMDERGEGVEGSGVFKKLNLKQTEIKTRIDKELSFWIKRAQSDSKVADTKSK